MTIVLVDRQTTNLPLEGTVWTVDAVISGDMVSSVPAGATSTLGAPDLVAQLLDFEDVIPAEPGKPTSAEFVELIHGLADRRAADILGSRQFADRAYPPPHMSQDMELFHSNVEFFRSHRANMGPDEIPQRWHSFPEAVNGLVLELFK